MDLTRPFRLAAALALTAACLTGPAANAVPTPASSCQNAPGAGKADINGDGYDDAVVGDPHATDGDRVASGAVRVLYGGPGGPGSGGATTLTPDSPGVASSAGPGASSGDGFGWSVATAHIDRDPCLDVVIGAPWREVSGKTDVGAVYVVYGSPRGLGKGRAGTIITPDAWNASAENSLFGYSLDGSDASGGEPASVAIGAPYTDRPGTPNAGAAYVMWFTRDGTPQNRKRYFEDQPRTVEGAKPAGLYGWSVALVSMYGDPGRRDLAVGAPREPRNRERQPGALVLLADVARPRPSAVMSLGPPDLAVPAGDTARIGFALAYAEAGGTHYLAAGVPGATVDGHRFAGAVALFASDGRDFRRRELITEGTHGSTTAVEDRDQFGRSVALGVDATNHVRLGVGMPFETSRVRHDGAAVLVPITGGGKAVDLNQAMPGVPGAPGESAHFGWSVRFTGGTLLTGIPDDRERPTGSVLVTAPNGANRQVLPPPSPAAMDFGSAL